MNIAALIVAAGRGTRAGLTDNRPKQYVKIANQTVLEHTLDCFLNHPEIKTVQVVVHADDFDLYREATQNIKKNNLLPPVAGGATRQASVYAGLRALRETNGIQGVLIHDAARPFVDEPTLDRVIKVLRLGKAAIAAEQLADTLKRGDADNFISETVPRNGLWRAQTPQAFPFDEIYQAHEKAVEHAKTDFTDDAAVAEWAKIPVQLVAGGHDNQKITTAEDLQRAAQRMSTTMTNPDIQRELRVGNGFDVHRFEDGDHVWLAGLKIPHTRALKGHSDADVGLHVLTDAILGAIGDGDIGTHFPPSDPQWLGMASEVFLKDAVRRVSERGGQITNIDLTLICEEPKIGPHREAMRSRLAEILGISVDRVSVKATTTEGLGFTGRKEGIAAMATASVMLPI